MADGSHITTAAGTRAAPDAVWAAAREDYLAGFPAREVCARHGVQRATLFKRARDEGWRRADQPWTPPGSLDVDDEGVELEARVDGDLDRIEFRDLAFVALQRAMRTVLRGDAVGALRWVKVQKAMEAEEAELQRLIAGEEALWAAGRGRLLTDDPDAVLDSLDSLDCVFEDEDAVRHLPVADGEDSDDSVSSPSQMGRGTAGTAVEGATPASEVSDSSPSRSDAFGREVPSPAAVRPATPPS